MRHFAVAFLLVLCVFVASAGATGPGIAGTWKTEKGAVVRCEEAVCTLVHPPEDPGARKPVGTVILKDVRLAPDGKGAGLLVHPMRDDKYLDVEIDLRGDAMTLTLRLFDRSTSAVWTRQK